MGLIYKYQVGGKVMNNSEFITTLNNQFIYPMDYNYESSSPLQHRAKSCQGPNCLEGANTYYNKYVAPKFSMPDTWKINEAYGITSGNPNTAYGESADSWDLASLLQAKGATKNYAAPLYSNGKRNDETTAEKNWNKLTPEEKAVIYSQMSLGTLVNYGDWGGIHGERKNGTNEKAGLYPSRHSSRVVGFTKSGEPVVYDYGSIVPISKSGLGHPVTNITTPKELTQYNYKYLQDWESKNNKSSGYNPEEKLSLVRGSLRPGEKDITVEESKYVEGINNNIKNLMQITGASQEDVIKAGKVAFGIMQGETRGGRSNVAKGKEIIKKLIPFSGEASQGFTRIKPDMQAGDETNAYSHYMKNLGLDPKNLDLWNPEQSALATTALILSRKGDIEGVDKWYLRAQQHNTPSVGPKNEKRLQEADKDYADNVIKNSSRLYSKGTGYGLQETEKWANTQKAKVNREEMQSAWNDTLKPKVMVAESTNYQPKVKPILIAQKKKGGSLIYKK